MSNKDSIAVYDLDRRVGLYDKDMDIMHPNCLKMIQIDLEFLPFKSEDMLKVVDLGIGSSFFTYYFLKKISNSRVIGMDGAKMMIKLAKNRLNQFSDYIQFRVGDFRDIGRLFLDISDVDVVISSYALHHLDIKEKINIFAVLKKLLRNSGWFINADLIIAESQAIEDRVQDIRVNGIVTRAKGKDNRFKDLKSTNKFIHDLEENESDQPLPLSKDLELLSNTGFINVDVLWKEYREVVICAQKK